MNHPLTTHTQARVSRGGFPPACLPHVPRSRLLRADAADGRGGERFAAEFLCGAGQAGVCVQPRAIRHAQVEMTGEGRVLIFMKLRERRKGGGGG